MTFNGNNGLNSRDMLFNRQTYNSYILTLLSDISEPTIETNQIKDFQKDEKMLYGRLDATVKNSVFPKAQYLKTFLSSNEKSSVLQAVNFVVNAFNDMKKKFDRDKANGLSIDPNALALTELNIEKAYVNPLVEYNNYKNIFISTFLKFVIENDFLRHISDFKSFVPIFMEFSSFISKNLPITRTMFLLSKYVSPRASGLVIEVYNGDYGDDSLKAELFYGNKNFEYFKNLAYVFGFMVDKHIPWRLVADLNSPRMKKYISAAIGPEDPSSPTTLPVVYTESYPDDLNSIVSLVVACYNEVARHRPVTRIVEPSSTIDENSSKSIFGEKCKSVKTIVRNTVDVNQTRASYPESYWLELYAQIRNFETGIKYNKGTMHNIIKNATDLSNSLDSQTALGYIARKFDNVEHFGGSLFYDVTRLEMAEDPEARESDVEEKVVRSVQNSNFVLY